MTVEQLAQDLVAGIQAIAAAGEDLASEVTRGVDLLEQLVTKITDDREGGDA